MDVPKGEKSLSANTVVAELETMLRDKLMDLTKRRNQLAADGRLDMPARMRLVAERLAVESVIVRKIWDAARGFDPKRPVVHAAEVQEIGAMIEAVRLRIRGDEKPMGNAMECLVDVLADKLVRLGDIAVEPRRFEVGACLADDGDLGVVIEQFREFKSEVEAYRTAMIPQVVFYNFFLFCYL